MSMGVDVTLTASSQVTLTLCYHYIQNIPIQSKLLDTPSKAALGFNYGDFKTYPKIFYARIHEDFHVVPGQKCRELIQHFDKMFGISVRDLTDFKVAVLHTKEVIPQRQFTGSGCFSKLWTGDT